MDAAMNVGIIALIIMAKSFEHRFGFLRGGGIIEINQRMTMNALIENWKIGTDRGPVHGRLCSWFAGDHSFSEHDNAYSKPNCSLAASVIIPWFQGGSHTNSTLTSSTPSSPSKRL